mgnify:CR=1 FL=1
MDYIINFAILILIYFLFFYQRWRRKGTAGWFWRTAMYSYIVMVIYFTLMPLTLPTGSVNHFFMETANFIPFRDVMHHYGGAVREVFLNVLLMMPFGFLLPLIKKKRLFATVFWTFAFSLAIECTQLISVWLNIGAGRAFDVTDLITNTFGGFCGYLLFSLFKQVSKRMVLIR